MELTMLLRCILPPDSQMARIRSSWHEASQLQSKYFHIKASNLPALHMGEVGGEKLHLRGVDEHGQELAWV